MASDGVAYVYSKEDFVYSTSSKHGQGPKSTFDSLLLKNWEAVRDSALGLFKYHVDDVETKQLPGRYSLIVQLNIDRKEKRRRPDDIQKLEQPLNSEDFNFTKVKKEEIIINLQYHLVAPKSEESKLLEASVIINNAPICYSHSLVVPYVSQLQPQVANREGIVAALHTVLLSQTSDIRIGYNSLGAFASVNHLHFHVYHLPHKLYIETAECEKLAGPCYAFKKYFAPGFVFQLVNRDVDELASSVIKVINLFREEQLPHNIYMTRGTYTDRTSATPCTYDTIRVILWVRKPSYGVKDVTTFCPAVCELAGHVPVYTREFWTELTEASITDTVHQVTSDCFKAIVPKVSSLFS